MNWEVFITCAVTGAGATTSRSDLVPVTPEQIAGAAIEAATAGAAIAHIHVNWLSPTKTRTMIVAGSKRVVVWDDLHPSQRLSMYDRGVELGEGLTNGARKEAVFRELMVSYRVGEMVAPVLKEAEALRGVVQEFTSAIREGRPPLTGGEAGLRVLRWLEAASHSLDRKGVLVPMEVF